MTIAMRTAAWLMLISIVLTTLTPIGPRPHVVDPTVAGFFAFAIFGIAAGAGYRRRFIQTLCLVVATAGIIEFLPSVGQAHDGSIPDIIIKVVGAGMGVVLGHVIGTMLASSIDQSQVGGS